MYFDDSMKHLTYRIAPMLPNHSVRLTCAVALVFAVVLVLGRPAAAQESYVNPVFAGDHPDPTLTKIGDDYYSSGSSFNVTPRIYHSTDLVHWEAIAQPVAADWELYGDSPGGGIWGGHTVRHNGLYWHFFGRGTGGREMYYVTSNRPEGPWSSPVQMRVASGVPNYGVDNSIFVDDDNRWFLLAKFGQSGNWIVELGPTGQPQGEVYDMTWLNPDEEDNPYGWAEGPVMWKHDGYYYYSFAQHLAGSQYVMRSAVQGAPLSDDPDAWETPRVMFQGARGDFSTPNHSSPAVTTADGTSWVISQSYDGSGNGEWQAQGRQGILSQIVYDEDGWPMAQYPSGVEEAPDLPSSGIPWTVPRSDMFDATRLAPAWSFLGFTPEDTYSLTARPGWLRLEPYNGTFVPGGQNTVIQDAVEHAFTLVTRVDFAPDASSDEAGLWTFNGPELLEGKLFVTAEGDGRAVTFSFDTSSYSVALEEEGPVWLRLVRDGHDLTGFYSVDGAAWTQVGEAIDASRMDRHMSSEEANHDFNAFTGSQQGPYVIGTKPADFDLYLYRDAYSRIPAEYPANFSGVVGTQGSGPEAGYLGRISDGDWAMYPGVEFGDAPNGGNDANYSWAPQALEVEAASATEGGTIEVMVDSLSGRKIGEVQVGSTGDWNTYETFVADVEAVDGQRDVFLRFVGSSDQLYRLRNVSFTGQYVGTAVDDLAEATTFKLAQNHPNPFRGMTTIAYELPQAGQVTLEVFDVVGRKVATLVDDVQAAGTHRVDFEGALLGSGAYFYRLTTGERAVTRTMTLAR